MSPGGRQGLAGREALVPLGQARQLGRALAAVLHALLVGRRGEALGGRADRAGGRGAQWACHLDQLPRERPRPGGVGGSLARGQGAGRGNA